MDEIENLIENMGDDAKRCLLEIIRAYSRMPELSESDLYRFHGEVREILESYNLDPFPKETP
jgi:hypothetical protein